MLESLHVKNLALIQETEVFFGPGLNILTGETGAGKSIILGSINLALGAKADKDMIRTGAEYALIELTFAVSEKERALLEAMEIPMEDNTVVLQRRVMPGRSVCRVNSETVTAKALKELAGILIDIHGQHDSQMLLQVKKHQDILDGFAGEDIAKTKAALKAAYQSYSAAKRELEENSMDEASRKRELSLAQYELDEITKASLQIGEDEQLEQSYRLMTNSQKIQEVLSNVYGFSGNDSGGAGENIGRALRQLGTIADFDTALLELNDQLAEIESLLNDLNRSLSDYMSELEFDEKAFYEVNSRLDAINHLKDKYGHTIEEVMDYAQKRAQDVERLMNQDFYLAKLKEQLTLAENDMLILADKLSIQRKKAAKKLEEQLVKALEDLNFLNVEFEVEIKKREHCGSDGQDDISFLLSTNPGEPKKPLANIASGGELSRIMLALKTVTAQKEDIGTFIFDEIDSGISGKTAWMVSNKLGMLGKDHQIICITHLPQIAAAADRHFYIQKKTDTSTTVTTIEELDEQEILEELARLSGAANINATALQNAKELKDLAERNK